MEKSLLAKELRTKQHKLGEVPKHIINRLSDEDIIDAYITCSCCGVKQVEGADLQYAIASAETVDHFFEIADKFGQAKHMVGTQDEIR